MPNHVHLDMVPSEEDGLHAALGEIHRHYTRHVNFRKGWRGHLWQERFHSFVMDENHLLATVRYVERKASPVPYEWPWSSAIAHLERQGDDLASVEPMLERVGDWRAYLSGNNKCGQEGEVIERHTRTGRPLIDEVFVGVLERMTGKLLSAKKPGRKPKHDSN